MEAYFMSLELGIPTEYNAEMLIVRAYRGADGGRDRGEDKGAEIVKILVAKGAQQAVELAAEAGVDEAGSQEGRQ